MDHKLTASVIILKRLANQMKHAADGLTYLLKQKYEVYNSDKNETDIFAINTCMYSVINSSLIWYASFLDEYNCNFKSEDDVLAQKIQEAHVNCVQYFETMDSIFPNLRTIRNQVLAHGYRNKSFIPLSDKEINDHYDTITKYESIDPYFQISNLTGLIMNEIIKSVGDVDESLLIEEEEG